MKKIIFAFLFTTILGAVSFANDCGPGWQNQSQYSCEQGYQVQRICGCSPPNWYDAGQWKIEDHGCYSRRVGNCSYNPPPPQPPPHQGVAYIYSNGMQCNWQGQCFADVNWGLNYPQSYETAILTVSVQNSPYGGGFGQPEQKLDCRPYNNGRITNLNSNYTYVFNVYRTTSCNVIPPHYPDATMTLNGY